VIYGERIRFRHAERSDLPAFARWFNDPEVRENLTMYLPMSQVNEEKWFEGMIQRHPDEQVMGIEVQEDDGWTLIGNCSFMALDRRVRSAEVGIAIGEKAYWNRGYGTEAIQLLLKHGFETLNLNRIYLRVYETNPRAIRAYEKAGFVPEGRLRQAQYKHGAYFDVLMMSVLRSEWEQAQA
jgi:RimJ/RimL family protein N-acetyltransferase